MVSGLVATLESDLAAIAHRVEHGTLSGADLIGPAVGPGTEALPDEKHFQIEITDPTFTYTRDSAGIAADAALDGFYILRTSLTDLPAGDVVRAYKNLEQAERAFGSLKGLELQIRPVHHHLADRVKAHVLILSAYYLTWHLKAAWKPLAVHRRGTGPPARSGRESRPLPRSAGRKHKRNRPPAASPRTATAPSWPSSPPQDPEHHPGARSLQRHVREAHPPTALQDRSASISSRYAPAVVAR